LVEATCNAHAFLKFRDIEHKYPVEYAEAGRVNKKVFDHDDEAKALGLTPADRMHCRRSQIGIEAIAQGHGVVEMAKKLGTLIGGSVGKGA
jgi:hypothetical protein